MKETRKKDILKTVKILQYLLEGQDIKIDQDRYAINEENEICIKGTIQKGELDKVETIYLPIYMSLKDFIDLCDKISEEEYFFLTAKKVLSKPKKKY